jgi:hypothetical protein
MARDRAFPKGTTEGVGVECLSGDLRTGKAILRDYIDATIGFDALSELTHKSAKSRMRRRGPIGPPRSPEVTRSAQCAFVIEIAALSRAD